VLSRIVPPAAPAARRVTLHYGGTSPGRRPCARGVPVVQEGPDTDDHGGHGGGRG